MGSFVEIFFRSWKMLSLNQCFSPDIFLPSCERLHLTICHRNTFHLKDLKRLLPLCEDAWEYRADIFLQHLFVPVILYMTDSLFLK